MLHVESESFYYQFIQVTRTPKCLNCDFESKEENEVKDHMKEALIIVTSVTSAPGERMP